MSAELTKPEEEDIQAFLAAESARQRALRTLDEQKATYQEAERLAAERRDRLLYLLSSSERYVLVEGVVLRLRAVGDQVGVDVLRVDHTPTSGYVR